MKKSLTNEFTILRGMRKKKRNQVRWVKDKEGKMSKRVKDIRRNMENIFHGTAGMGKENGDSKRIDT